MRLAGLALVCGVLAASVASAAAGEWPDRPLTMVYPFTPGSAGDGIGRILAARLAELLGRPVLFENVGGAGGMTGALRVARGEPDGSQFLLGGTFLVVNQVIHRQAPFDAVNDFAPVALLSSEPTVLIGRKDLPADNLPELIAYTRANRGKVQYGSAGVGAVTHLSCLLLTSAIGSDAVHVPYRGGGGALQDLLAGRIDYQCPILNVALAQIQAGNVKALAILSKQRSPALPGLASAHEQGLADFDVTNWYAFFLPKRTPAAIVQKLHDASAAALDTPSVQEKLRVVGAAAMPPAQRSPDYLKTHVGREIAKWTPPIMAAGAQVD
jgi:tripartite-type tricarboxylate transporter receptor subunit TctC